MKDDAELLAKAIWGTLQSLCVPAANDGPSNVVDVLDDATKALYNIAESIDNLAEAIRNH